MGLSAVEKLSIDQSFVLMGTPMTATPDGGSPIPLTVVWDTPDFEDAGPGKQLRRAIWYRTSELATADRGTVFVGPEPHGGADKTWRLDELLKEEPGLYQVQVVEVL